MLDLIESLTIFAKYGNPHAPTHCEHDILFIDINPDEVSEEDKVKLCELGFEVGEAGSNEEGGFWSFRYGSC